MKRTMEQNRGNEKTVNASKALGNAGEHTTEVVIGSTRFVVTSECSPAATETLEQKLMRIMGRHVCEAGKSLTRKPLKSQTFPAL